MITDRLLSITIPTSQADQDAHGSHYTAFTDRHVFFIDLAEPSLRQGMQTHQGRTINRGKGVYLVPTLCPVP